MKCENCGREHDGHYGSGRFCSSYCARSYSTKGNRKDINKKVSLKLGGDGEIKGGRCPSCNNLVTKKRVFCNKKCYNNYLAEKWKEFKNKVYEYGNFNFKGNNITYGNPVKKIKKFLKEEQGIRCTICNTESWQGREIPLILDHINGNSDDWSLDNLRLICPNCDHMLPTFAGKNVGNDNNSNSKRNRKRNKRYYRSVG